MFRIVEAEFLAPDIKRFVIEAPRIARKRQAGQFVIVRVHDRGERIPLTIADSDPERGTITLIVQGIGKTTKLMNLLGAGDALLDLVGPLGKPSEVKNYGTVVVIGGGVGAAIAYPTAKAMHEAGNHVISILGGRSRDLVILEAEVRAISDEVFVTTDDGSYGRKGLVIDPLKEMIAAGRPIDLVLAIGPVRMMQAVAEVTRPHRIHTVVSLNSLMVDGTGMCGGCRIITTAGRKFACVDGPEFDAHTVDFDILAQRNRTYADREAEELREFREHAEECVQRGPRVVPARGRPPRSPARRGAECHEREEAVAQGADEDPPAAHAGAAGRGAPAQLQRGQPGPDRPGRDHRGAALPGVRQAALRARAARSTSTSASSSSLVDAGRLPGGGGQDPRGQRPAGHHRPRLPAGDAVRGVLHPGQQVRAAGHRLPGAVRRRLRARARPVRPAREGAAPPARRSPSSAAARPA